MRRNTLARGALLAGIGGLLLVLAGCDIRTDSFRPVTHQGTKIANLFLLSFILSALVFLLVAGVMTYNLIRFRARPGAGPASTTHGNKRLELAWTASPFVLLVVLFILSMRVMTAVGDPPPSALTIDVVGHQWWWEYQYPGQGVVTANELHLPLDRTVQLKIGAADVIHSFWVPRIGWKMDAIPGKTNEMTVYADKAGTFDGTCAEYCGAEHAWMRIRVIVQPAPQFDAWLKAQAQSAPLPQSSVALAGEQVFLQNTCVSCHTVAGTAANGTVGPNLTHFGSRETIGSGVVPNTPANLTRWIRNAKDIKPDVLMPAYNLSDQELQALVRYLEGLK